MAFANLGLSLTARTTKFRKSMKGARASIVRFGASVRKAGTRLTQFAAVGAAAATAAVTLMVKRQFTLQDSLGKTAAKLGIGTIALGAYRRSAELSGVEVKTLEKGLTNLAVRVAEAALGTGMGVRAFEDLGLNAEKLFALSMDEQFLAVADALKGLTNQTLKVRIAYDLFGGRATALLNTMKGGSAALLKQREELKKFGLALSDLDVRQIESANDALADVGRVFEGIAAQLAKQLAPVIGGISNLFIAAATSGRGVGDAIAEGVNFAIQSLGGFAITIMNLKARLLEFSADVRDAFEDMFPSPFGTGTFAVGFEGEKPFFSTRQRKGFQDTTDFLRKEADKIRVETDNFFTKMLKSIEAFKKDAKASLSESLGLGKALDLPGVFGGRRTLGEVVNLSRAAGARGPTGGGVTAILQKILDQGIAQNTFLATIARQQDGALT